jgi:ABC-type Fe3+-hydroxamate transport system substrate-binding protein
MKPLRIISLVPSQTELLYYLGVPPIAQTIFCVHPSEAFKASVKIGGTKKLNIQKILDLQPDLVIGNIEENEKSQIELLQQNVKVWMTDIYTFDDALESITTIGEWVNKPQATVLYLIWKNPYMAVGRNTFINSMLQKAGFVNSIQAPESRYPELDITDIIALNPDRIFLSSEPYPFKKEDFLALQNALPHTQIQMVDGEQFSWYGNRMLLAADYFTQL